MNIQIYYYILDLNIPHVGISLKCFAKLMYVSVDKKKEICRLLFKVLIDCSQGNICLYLEIGNVKQIHLMHFCTWFLNFSLVQFYIF